MQTQTKDKNEELRTKLKQSWSRLSDEDVALYTSGREDDFFDVLEEKHGVLRDEAEDRMEEIRLSCGCASNADKAA